MSLGARKRPAATTWYVEIDKQGNCSVSMGGRSVLSGVPWSSAASYLRHRRKKGDKAYMVEPDGYRTPM